MHPSHEAREMQGQAEYWFFRLLEPDCSASEREACRLWRAEDPANEAAWRDVAWIWQDSSELMSDPAIAQAVRQAEVKCGTKLTHVKIFLAKCGLPLV